MTCNPSSGFYPGSGGGGGGGALVPMPDGANRLLGVNAANDAYETKDATMPEAGSLVLPGTLTLSAISASLPVFTDGSKIAVSNAKTGSGSVVMSSNPQLDGLPKVDGLLNLASATATPAGGNALRALAFGSGDGIVGVYWGSGAPTITAGKGSLYLRTDGGATSRAYINTDSAATWTALVSEA